MRRRSLPLWLLLVLAGTLGGMAALGLERGMAALAPSIMPGAPEPAQLPTREPPLVVVLPTTNSTTAPTPASGDTAGEISALQSELTQQRALLLVLRAERHTSLASDALFTNDYAAAERELVAARAALDNAFGLVPEALKQVIDGQRREVASMRGDLQIDPEGMHERLRATQDLLLGVVVPLSE